MDLKLIKNILELISDSDVNEVSLEEGDFKIKVKKQGEVQQVSYTQAAAPQPMAQPAAPAQPQQAASGSDQSQKEDQPEGETVTSPIVGTYYESPSPDSDPFIKVGDKVSKGDTLCIEAEFGGTVQKILVNDAQPVEFEQPLFIIKKD
jgi:acetyl-CoA carboxylase biotin carboxyl carrier protein